ncbi:alpha/beta fold hydrolase [Fibrella sp. WM1]|uniref:alpha/beta fold hydrolase n=1 Tax=Fibrella musci TaxID=3242485 RepID=UPI003521E8E8
MIADILRQHNVTIRGQGAQPMLFAHGFGCDQHMWRYVTPAFEPTHRVICFDYLGHGDASLEAYNPERYASLHGYAQDILDICRALDLRQVILVGHSVSSMIGLLACIQEPDRFERLIMVAPSSRYLNDDGYFGGFERDDIDGLLETMDGNFPGWASAMAPVIMSNADRPQLSQELTTSFCKTDLEVARQFARVTFLGDNRRDLPNMPVPALIIQAQDDVIAPVEVGNYLVSHMPHSTLRIIPVMGHCPHLSAPQLTIDAIRDYLTISH